MKEETELMAQITVLKTLLFPVRKDTSYPQNCRPQDTDINICS